jgi:hypothetical protein
LPYIGEEHGFFEPSEPPLASNKILSISNEFKIKWRGSVSPKRRVIFFFFENMDLINQSIRNLLHHYNMMNSTGQAPHQTQFNQRRQSQSCKHMALHTLHNRKMEALQNHPSILNNLSIVLQARKPLVQRLHNQQRIALKHNLCIAQLPTYLDSLPQSADGNFE